MPDSWSQWFRANFDKFLLLILFLVLIMVVLHMAHHNLDKEQISWGREQSGTVLGALLGLITGTRIGLSMTGHQPPPGTVMDTTTVAKIHQEGTEPKP